MVFGSVEFARMMMVRQSLTNAAREGCRHACLVSTRKASESDQVVRDALQAVMHSTNNEKILRITFSPSFAEAPPTGTTITSTVEVDCEDVSWLPPFFCANTRIRATSSMIRE
jgi:Flp pilus assembly protein TadG